MNGSSSKFLISDDCIIKCPNEVEEKPFKFTINPRKDTRPGHKRRIRYIYNKKISR
jgi:hypothetical protein